MLVRRAKIVCTVGPAVDTPEAIRTLIEAGMDVARLNFSHGAQADHERRMRMISEQSELLGRPIAVLQDLCGP
jgi:pyruvate kinase